MTGYRLAVDIGGTFTDVVLQGPSADTSGKVLTTGHAPEEGVLNGIAKVLGETGVRPDEVELIIHGTTLATNAIIERRGARTALLATKGFRDTLEFAFGHRFDQYDLEMTRPPALVERPLRFEIPERIAADGSVLLPLDEAAVHELVPELRKADIQSVAISFMHSYANAAHEARVREILLADMPHLYVSVSHEVCPEIREYERASTTAGNAYVQPLMASYLKRLVQRLEAEGARAPLLMIMSSGSLTSVETAMRFPIRLVESGPAGGAILGQHVARQMGAAQSIALDMGGTTAKIILLNDYEPRHSRSLEVARVVRFLPGSGLPLRIPVIDMIEIGAGGGSIAHVDQLGRINVGPESAGSSPGPACYGLGGTRPTVTDSDLLLGKLDAKAFAGGRMQLDIEGAQRAVAAHVSDRMGVDTVTGAAGIIEIVDENMANATRVHATDNGDEIESRVLIATGGAAPLHAGRIAQKLGLSTVIIPKGAGVGSAHGFLKAPVAYEAVASKVISLSRFEPDELNAIFAKLRKEAETIVQLASGYGELRERRFADMRYRGQGHDLSVELPLGPYSAESAKDFAKLFDAQYQRNYSRTIPNLGVEALTWTLVLARPAPGVDAELQAKQTAPSRAPIAGTRKIFDAALGRSVEASILQREDLVAGATFNGPAVVVEDQTTTFVPSDFDGRVSGHGHLVLTRRS
jgi:N-methylhydantoinase A